MDNLDLLGIILFDICFVVIAFTVLCLVLAVFGYKLHISNKKIEILPAKESPKKDK